MPTFRLNKLIRNKLVEMYDDLGQGIVSRQLGGKGLQLALRDKIFEETSEIPIESGSRQDIIDEIADVEQVLDDLKSSLSITDDDVQQAKARKLDNKGGFSNGIFVETITLDDNDEWVEYYRNEPRKYTEISVKEQPSLEVGVYRHTKSGKEYEVLGTALHTETNEVHVVYKPLYKSDHELFVRPLYMFLESVKLDDKTLPRFEKID